MTIALWLTLLATYNANASVADDAEDAFPVPAPAPEPMSKEERLEFIRAISDLDYTPSLLTQADRSQDLFFLPLKEFSGNVLFRQDDMYQEISDAVDAKDIYPLLRLYRADKTSGATKELLHALLLLLSPNEDTPLKESEVYAIRIALEKTMNKESVNLTNAFASMALSSYYRKQQEYRKALDSIMKGITLLPAFQHVSDHESTLVTLAANYQLAAFYYSLRDMQSAADTYQKIIYEGSAYISATHQAAHTRRLIDVLFQQQRFDEALPHAERLLNQQYNDPSLKAKAQYIYGKLLVEMGDTTVGMGYFKDVAMQSVIPPGDKIRACRSLYQLRGDMASWDCMSDLIDDVSDPEFRHYWHKLNYLKLLDENKLEAATTHIKAMVSYVRQYMDEVISRQSQRLLLEYNVDMAKKQASELKVELKLKKDYLAQNERNEMLYNLMIGIVGVAVALGITLLLRERKNRQSMHDMAMTDTLTGLPNRRAILDKAEKLALNSQKQSPWVLSILDLDHFKQINDTYGHDGGDAVLELFASTCQRLLPEGASLGRYGGEEFMLIMPDANQEDMKLFFTRLQKALQHKTITVNDMIHDITVTLSAGAADVSWENNEKATRDSNAVLDDIVKIADDCVYEAKSSGRDNLVTRPFTRD